MKIKDIIETATAGATASGNIASVVNPHIAIGNKAQQKSSRIMKTFVLLI